MKLYLNLVQNYWENNLSANISQFPKLPKEFFEVHWNHSDLVQHIIVNYNVLIPRKFENEICPQIEIFSIIKSNMDYIVDHKNSNLAPHNSA